MVVVALLGVILAVSTSWVGATETPCRRAPTTKLRRGFSQQDSDGITRSTGDCKTPDGYLCDMCCNGSCCERVDGITPFQSGEQLWVPVRFIIIVGGSETSLIGAREINYQLDVLNTAYSGIGYHFFYHSFQLYKDDKMKSSCNTDPCYLTENCDYYTYTMPQVRMNSEQVVNVVVCALSYFGEAQFPWASVENHPHQYIQVGFQAFADRGIVVGTTYGHGKTLVHEMGHYFGLLHTFERPGKCDAEGDYVADTPSASEAATQSQPCGTVMDSCPSKPGADDFSNYMNYCRDDCMDHFSAGQLTRMQQATRKYRPILVRNFLVNGSCPSPTERSLSSCTCNNGNLPQNFCHNAGSVPVPYSTLPYVVDGEVPNTTVAPTVAPTIAPSSTVVSPSTDSPILSTGQPAVATPLPPSLAPLSSLAPVPAVSSSAPPAPTQKTDKRLSNGAIIALAVIVSLVILGVLVLGAVFWAKRLIRRDKRRLEKYMPAAASSAEDSEGEHVPRPGLPQGTARKDREGLPPRPTPATIAGPENGMAYDDVEFTDMPNSGGDSAGV